MASDNAKNLEAIQMALVQHNGNCPGNIYRIEMNPTDYQKLGWEDFRGVPIEPEPKVPRGGFHLRCDLDGVGSGDAEEVGESEDMEYVTPTRKREPLLV